MSGQPHDEEPEHRGAGGHHLVAVRPPLLKRSLYSSGAPGGGDVPARAEQRMRFARYLRIGQRRKGVMLGITLAILGIGIIRTSMITPLYTSTVRLQIDRQSVKVVEAGTTSPTDSSESDFLRTQIELLQSRAMAERVTTALHLGDDADFFKPRGMAGVVARLLSHATSPLPDAAQLPWSGDRAAVAIVMQNRSVRPLPGARLVDVTYADPSPTRAQAIAAGLGEAFIAANLDKRFQANAYAKGFLDDQIKQLKLRLETSERGLLAFAEREQIVVVNEKSSNAENNLAAANAALGGLISERIRSEQTWNQVAGAKATAINLPQLLSNSVIDGLRGRRNLLETEFREKLETFKPGYPAMVQIRNKITEIDRQLETEVSTLKSSFKAAYENALNQEIEFKKRIAVLKEEVLDLQKRSIQYNILKREVDSNRQLYDGLLQRFKEVDIASGVGANTVFVIDRAEVAGAPSSPDMAKAILLSLVLGLGIACATAYGLERLDDTVHDAGEVERLLGLPTLGIIPKVRTLAAMETALADPGSSVSEAYRSLGTALQFCTERGLPRSLFVTSAGPSEGKSFTALAIARHFARLGLKVLLVDADLRNPSLHTKLDLGNVPGLSSYLAGTWTPSDYFRAIGVANLAFMPSGPLPPNAADLLGSARLQALVSVGLEVFDLIVFDGPPVMGLADALIISNTTAGTLVMVAAGQVRTRELAGAIRRMRAGPGALLGTVVSKFDARTAGDHYGYGYEYGPAYRRSTSAPHDHLVQPGSQRKLSRAPG